MSFPAVNCRKTWSCSDDKQYFLSLAKLSLIITLVRVLEKMIGRAICTRSMQSCPALRSDSTMKIVTAFAAISSLRASQ
jgi:hypothetical protein